MTPGPYQFCNSCSTERAHGWIATNIFKCIACNAETIVKDRPAIPREAIFPGIGKVLPMKEVKGKEHLLPEEQSALAAQLSSEPVAKAKEAKSEPIDAAIATAQVTELPLQGHQIKAKPIEFREEIQGATPELIAEVERGMAAGKKAVEEYIESGGKINYGTSGSEKIIPPGVGIIENLKLEEKPKPPTMNWADDL